MKLALKEKVFSLREAFQVMDEEGHPVYEVIGKLLSVGHKLTVTDMEGQEVAYIHQKVLSLVPKYFIAVGGQEEVELKGHITLLKPHYTLEAGDGKWEIRGDFTAHEYEMKRGHDMWPPSPRSGSAGEHLSAGRARRRGCAERPGRHAGHRLHRVRHQPRRVPVHRGGHRQQLSGPYF